MNWALSLSTEPFSEYSVAEHRPGVRLHRDLCAAGLKLPEPVSSRGAPRPGASRSARCPPTTAVRRLGAGRLRQQRAVSKRRAVSVRSKLPPPPARSRAAGRRPRRQLGRARARCGRSPAAPRTRTGRSRSCARGTDLAVALVRREHAAALPRRAHDQCGGLPVQLTGAGSDQEAAEAGAAGAACRSAPTCTRLLPRRDLRVRTPTVRPPRPPPSATRSGPRRPPVHQPVGPVLRGEPGARDAARQCVDASHRDRGGGIGRSENRCGRGERGRLRRRGQERSSA